MIRYGIVFLFLGVTLALPFVIFGAELESLFAGEGALQLLRSYTRFGWLVAMLLLIADLVLPIPTTAVFAALGIVYGPWVGGLIAASGSFLSGVLAYALCRRYGYRVAHHFAGPDAMRYGEDLFARAGGWLVAFSRWLPLLPEVVACLAGLSNMPYKPFIIALLCGVVPVGFVFAFVGHSGAEWPVLTLTASALAPLILWFLVRPARFVKDRS